MVQNSKNILSEGKRYKKLLANPLSHLLYQPPSNNILVWQLSNLRQSEFKRGMVGCMIFSNFRSETIIELVHF